MGAVVWLCGYTELRDVFVGGGSEISSSHKDGETEIDLWLRDMWMISSVWHRHDGRGPDSRFLGIQVPISCCLRAS
jgi:hypothetical protein